MTASGRGYVGQAIDLSNFGVREGVRRAGWRGEAILPFDVMGRWRPGLDLNVMEEATILSLGGTRNMGGWLDNIMHAPGMGRGGINFTPAVDGMLWGYQKQMMLSSSLLNGGVGAAGNLAREE